MLAQKTLKQCLRVYGNGPKNISVTTNLFFSPYFWFVQAASGAEPYQLRWQNCLPCWVLPLPLLVATAAPWRLHTQTLHTDAQPCLPSACLLLVTPFILGVIFVIAWHHACPGPHTPGILGTSVLTSAVLWGWTGMCVKHFSRAVNVINC